MSSEDILHAPQFAEIAALLLDVLSGTVAIAAHNVRFDRQFLEREFSRLECQLPDCFGICTMQLAGGGRLADCCRDYGISPEDEAHHALADARAAALLLTCLLADQPRVVQKLSTLDHDSGGFVLSEMDRNIRICVDDKIKKVSRVREKYSEWWLALVDHIGYGVGCGDRADLGQLLQLAHSWDKIVLVSPLDPKRGFEL